MPRGGKRNGSGRKNGSKTKVTSEIAVRAASEGVSPLEYMLNVMRDENASVARRDAMACAAAPYTTPRLAALTVEAQTDSRVEVEYVNDFYPAQQTEEEASASVSPPLSAPGTS